MQNDNQLYQKKKKKSYKMAFQFPEKKKHDFPRGNTSNGSDDRFCPYVSPSWRIYPLKKFQSAVEAVVDKMTL